MTYRTKTLLRACAGLVVVAGLGAWAYFGLYLGQREDARHERDAKLALNLFKDRVARIELQLGDERIVLERRGVGEQQLVAWRMIEPVEDDGDAATIDGLLGALERMDAERRLSGDEVGALGRFGLDPPRAHWKLILDEGEPIGFGVGKKSPFDNQIYLRRDGSDEVLLVKGHLESSLVVEAFELREKRVLRVEPALVKRLLIESQARKADSIARPLTIELVRKPDGWWLVQPLADRADGGEVARLLNALRNLRSRAFPGRELPDSSYGLDKPGWKIQVFDGPDGQRQEVWLARGRLPSNEQKLFARRIEPAGPLAEVPAQHLGSFDRTPFDLQAKAPIEFEIERVARVRIAGQSELVVLERQASLTTPDGGAGPAGAEWSLVSPLAGPAKRYKVQALLGGLAGLKATRFAGLPEPAALERSGLSRPIRTIAVFGENGKEIGTLRIGATTPEGTFVLGSARDQICLVPAAKLAGLPTRADLLGGQGASTGSKNP